MSEPPDTIDALALQVLVDSGVSVHACDLAQAVLLRGAEIRKLREAIRRHRDQKGDDRCWLDDRELYAVLGGEQPDMSLPPEAEFLESCRRFHRQRQPEGVKDGHPSDMTMGQLTLEVTNLRAALAMRTGDLLTAQQQLADWQKRFHAKEPA